MATAQVVITTSNGDTPAIGGLFDGLSFFLVQRLPSRGAFIDKIQANGGRVVRIEAQADQIIADHYRKDCPPGSISYTFIDDAIKNEELPDPKAHLAGVPKGTMREPGSTMIPARGTRTPFTAEDDRELSRWVVESKRNGGAEKGNEIYKQLEARNPRHTYQAWRDRYIKKLMSNPPAGVEVNGISEEPADPTHAPDGVENGPIQPSTQHTKAKSPAKTQLNGTNNSRKTEPEAAAESNFTQDEIDDLLEQAHDIETISDGRYDEAWQAYAQAFPRHSEQEWRAFYEKHVRAEYLRRLADRKRKRTAEQKVEEVTDTSPTTNGSVATQVNGTAKEPKDKDERATVGVPKTPTRPGSSGSQKRKRDNPIADALPADGRKKLRSAKEDATNEYDSVQARFSRAQGPPRKPAAQATEIPSNDEDEGQHGKQPAAQQLLRTSELNTAAQDQLVEEEGTNAAGPVPTSDLNREAQAQFDEEVLGVSQTEEVANYHITSNLPTSDANRAADRQLQLESLERIKAVEGGSSSHLPTPNQPVSRPDYVVPSQLESAALERVESQPLTVANLATQQAQQEPQTARGVDLPEDDDRRDSSRQDEFANYMQEILKSSGLAPPVRSAVVVEEDHTEAEASELPGLHEHGFGLDKSANLPMSQEELEVMDDVIQWPDSPKRTPRKETQSQSFRFETQIDYPTLPKNSRPDQAGNTTSQIASLKAVSYPLLPEQERLQKEDDVVSESSMQPMQVSVSPNSKSKQYRTLASSQPRHVIHNRHEDIVESMPAFRAPPGSAGGGWTQKEDELVIQGVRNGWKSPTIVSRSKMQRSESAVRNRRALLLEKRPGLSGSQQSSREADEDVPSASQEAALGRAESLESESSYVLVRGDGQETAQQSDQQDEMDLSVPEPEEVWEKSSSPVRSITSQPSLAQPQHQEDIVLVSDPAQDRREDIRPTNEVHKPIDISSDSSSISSNDLEQHPAILATTGVSRNRALETQDILNVETQQPDFDFPLPPDSDEELDDLPSDPLDPPSSTPIDLIAESQARLPHIGNIADEDLGVYIDKMIVYGYDSGSIINALKCTSMRPDLAELVLLDEKAGKGVPVDVAGIWLEDEDQVLESGNAKGLKKLEDKHSWKECEDRLLFLREWRDDEEEE